MTTFTGYEPKARGIRASGQIVPEDNLAQDLSMVSSLEEFLDETIVPVSTHVLGQSGTKVLADASQSDTTKKKGHGGENNFEKHE